MYNNKKKTYYQNKANKTQFDQFQKKEIDFNAINQYLKKNPQMRSPHLNQMPIPIPFPLPLPPPRNKPKPISQKQRYGILTRQMIENMVFSKRQSLFFNKIAMNAFMEAQGMQKISTENDLAIIVIKWLMLSKFFQKVKINNRIDYVISQAKSIAIYLNRTIKQILEDQYLIQVSQVLIISKQDQKQGIYEFLQQYDEPHNDNSQSKSQIDFLMKKYYINKQKQYLKIHLKNLIQFNNPQADNNQFLLSQISQIKIKYQNKILNLIDDSFLGLIKQFNKNQKAQSPQIQAPKQIGKIPTGKGFVKIGTYVKQEHKNEENLKNTQWNFYSSFFFPFKIIATYSYQLKQIIIYLEYTNFTMKGKIPIKQSHIQSILNYQNYALIILKKNIEFVGQYLPPNVYSNNQQYDFWHQIGNFALDYNQKLNQNQFLKLIFNKYPALCIYTYDDKIYLPNRQEIQKKHLFENIFQDNKNFKQLFIKDTATEHHTINIKQLSELQFEFRNRMIVYLEAYQSYLTAPSQYPQPKKKEKLLEIHFIELDYLLFIQTGKYIKLIKQFQILQKEHNISPDKYQLKTVQEFLHDLYLFMHYQMTEIDRFTSQKMIKQIPEHKLKKPLLKVYNIAFTPSGIKYKGYTNQFSCRVFRQFPCQLFIKVTFCNDNGSKIISQTKNLDYSYLINNVFWKNIQGFILAKKRYIPLGWSNSQIKRSQLWFVIDHQYFNPSPILNLRQDIYNFLGKFTDIPGRVRAARIGQNFATSVQFSQSSNINPIYIGDILSFTKKHIFTDGIGQISKNLLDLIKKQNKFSGDVCALQIRYKGCKGVLSLGVRSYQSDWNVYISKSMVKFQSNDDQRVKKHFDVLNWNKYSPGSINVEVIMLLLSLKVPLKIIQNKMRIILQKELYNLKLDKNSIINYFKTHLDYSPVNEDSLFDLLTAINSSNNQIKHLLSEQIYFCELLAKVKRQISLKIKRKLRFRIDKSVRLMGIIDTYQILKQNQVFCSYRRDKDQQKINVTQRAFITKNPCLHPGDIRIVKCVSIDQIRQRLKLRNFDESLYDCYTNVIVFPQQGQYPLSAIISGGDLDGDYYLLCWDQQLIPKYTYSININDDNQAKQNQKFKVIEHNGKEQQVLNEQLLKFFIQYIQKSKLGLITSYHQRWAQYRKATCKQCIELSKIHSFELDFGKKGKQITLDKELIPPKYYKTYLQRSQNKKTKYNTDLGQLHKIIKSEYFIYQIQQRLLDTQLHQNINWSRAVTAFTYSKKEISQALQVLCSYKFQIEGSLIKKNKVNNSQFTIYHGKDEQFISDSITIREKYKTIFFGEDIEDKYEMQKLTLQQIFKQDNSLLFREKFYKKLYLWYIISNSISLESQVYQNKHIIDYYKPEYKEIIKKASGVIKEKMQQFKQKVQSGQFQIEQIEYQDGNILQQPEKQKLQKWQQQQQQKQEQQQKRYIKKKQTEVDKKPSTQKKGIKVFPNVYGLCWNVIPKLTLSLILQVKFNFQFIVDTKYLTKLIPFQ